MVQSGHAGSTGQLVHGSGSVEVLVTSSPFGSFPVAVAKLYTIPASISAWVTVWTAVNVVLSEAPTAKLANGPPLTTALLSVTVMLVKVVLPVFLTTKVYFT